MLFRVVLCLVLVTGTFSFSFSNFLHRRNIHQRNTKNRRNEGDLKISVAPEDFTVDRGVTLLYFYCKAEGNPPPTTYEWYMGDKKLKKSWRYIITNEPEGDGSSLVVDTPRASANFTCVASNGVTNVTATALGQLTGGQHRWAPTLQWTPGSRRVKTGGSVRFTCSTHDLPKDAPKAKMFWLKNYHPFKTEEDNDTDDRVHMASEGSLIFKTTVADDNAHYSCITKNEYGSDASYPVTLLACDSKDDPRNRRCKDI